MTEELDILFVKSELQPEVKESLRGLYTSPFVLRIQVARLSLMRPTWFMENKLIFVADYGITDRINLRICGGPGEITDIWDTLKP